MKFVFIRYKKKSYRQCGKHKQQGYCCTPFRDSTGVCHAQTTCSFVCGNCMQRCDGFRQVWDVEERNTNILCVVFLHGPLGAFLQSSFYPQGGLFYGGSYHGLVTTFSVTTTLYANATNPSFLGWDPLSCHGSLLPRLGSPLSVPRWLLRVPGSPMMLRLPSLLCTGAGCNDVFTQWLVVVEQTIGCAVFI